MTTAALLQNESFACTTVGDHITEKLQLTTRADDPTPKFKFDLADCCAESIRSPTDSLRILRMWRSTEDGERLGVGPHRSAGAAA